MAFYQMPSVLACPFYRIMGVRDETKEAMRMFSAGRCYTAENPERDYLAEVANYNDDRWEAPQWAAHLAAAVKRFKT